MESIKFFDRSSPYFEFSNYYPCTFVLEDHVWHSVESYYQSQKFNDARTNLFYQLITQADSPQKAKDMGNLRPNPRGSNWLINKNCPELGKMNEIIREFKTYTHIRSNNKRLFSAAPQGAGGAGLQKKELSILRKVWIWFQFLNI